MSFTQNIKLELLNKEFNKEEALTLLSGLISTSSTEINNQIIIKLNRENISSIVWDISKQLNLKITHSKSNHNWLILQKDVIPEFRGKLPSQYFAGVFLGGGSISDPSSSSYHLELQLYKRQEAMFIQKYLNKYNFDFSIIRRRNNWVLYIKKAEQISDFLKAIQAISALLIFEDSRILRDYHNNLNRMSNLDVYNQKKLALSSRMYNKMYAKILEHDLAFKFKRDEIIFFNFKTKNPELSLSELVSKLAEEHNIKKTRSGLNHWLRKLKNIYDNYII